MAELADAGSGAAGNFLLPVASRASADAAYCLPWLSPLLSRETSGSTPSFATISLPFFGSEPARQLQPPPTGCFGAVDSLVAAALGATLDHLDEWRNATNLCDLYLRLWVLVREA